MQLVTTCTGEHVLNMCSTICASLLIFALRLHVFWYFLLNGNKGASATATATVLHAVTSLMLYIWKKNVSSHAPVLTALL